MPMRWSYAFGANQYAARLTHDAGNIGIYVLHTPLLHANSPAKYIGYHTDMPS
jgi:hypothetical protein